MTFSGHVVGLWATLNAAFALVMLAYGAGPFPLLCHLGGAALIAAFGLAVWVAARRGAVGPQRRQPYRSLVAVSGGVSALVFAWGFAYGSWIFVLGAYPLVLFLVMLRRERLPRGTESVPEDAVARVRSVPVEAPTDPATARREGLLLARKQRRRRRGEAT